MEFAVAAFSAVVGAAMNKLSSIPEQDNKLKTDATIISNRLGMIKAGLEEYANEGGSFGPRQKQWIAQRRRLAYDIEDRVDCFHAKKTTLSDFRTEVAQLMARSAAMNEDIKALAAEQNVMQPPVAQGAVGTVQQVAIVPTAATKLPNAPGDNLKCLLYLCLFPPNHDVRTKPLIRRWLAEGLVEGEDVGNDNLRFLIDSRYMSSILTSNNGKVKRCQTTQETFEDISQQSMSEKFIVLCDGTAQLQEEEAYRLSLRPSADARRYLPAKLPCLRTLAVFPPPPAAAGGAPASHASYEDALNFARYEVLRVLDLKECADLSDGHIQAICKQVLMRYLSINLGSIDRIGRKIGRLEQLETLDLSGSQTVTVFKEVLLLPKLKHLLGKFQLSRIDTAIDTYSCILRWFGKSRLNKFLSTNESKLETLAGFVTNDRPGFPQLMSLMRKLRKVKIWCEANASEENLGAISRAIWKFSRDGISELHHHRSLTIDFQECSGQFLNTEHPDAANGKLDSLKLRGHLSVFPKFVENLSVIQELCLWSTGLSWQHIRNGLCRVSGLKYLKIIDDNLQVFVAALVQADALPDLVSLHIICPNLDVLPGTPGIEIAHMKNLKEVALHHQVRPAIRTKWQQAVNGHTNRPLPVLLFVEGP